MTKKNKSNNRKCTENKEKDVHEINNLNNEHYYFSYSLSWNFFCVINDIKSLIDPNFIPRNNAF